MANGSEDRRPVPADFQAVIESIELLSPRYRAAFTPQPRSIAARNVKTRVGRHAIELAATGLSLSLEHLDVWRRLVVDAHLAPFAYLTLVRASIEGVVLARWLLDPHMTRDERRARGLGAPWVGCDWIANWVRRETGPDDRDRWRPVILGYEDRPQSGQAYYPDDPVLGDGGSHGGDPEIVTATGLDENGFPDTL